MRAIDAGGLVRSVLVAAPGLALGWLVGAQGMGVEGGGWHWHDPAPALALLLAMLLAWSLHSRWSRADRLHELAESEARLTAVIESALDAIVVVDEEFRITLVNGAAEQIFACCAADSRGRPLADFVPERFREKQTLEYETFAASDQPSARFGGLRARFGLRGNGEEFPFDGSISRTRVRGHTFYTLIIRDTSEQVRAAAALESSVSLLRSTLESTADGILVVDRAGRVVSYNGTFLEMWDIPAEAAQSGQDNRVLPLATQRVADPEGFRRRVAELYVDWEAESFDVIHMRDGRIFERLSRPQRLDGGEVVGRVWSFRDVTERARSEQALRQAEKLAALGQLVSGVAHELNNPLTAILHFADDMLADARVPQDLDALTIIRQQATRSRAIVRDLSSFARSRRAATTVAPLREVIEGAVRALEPQLRDLGVALAMELDGELGAAEVDAPGIEQVIANLVVNAAQAAGRGGHVRVAAARGTDARCRITIEDDGPGIPDAVLPRIFEPFFTTKPAGVGTGLGLSVSLGIVEQHRGTLTAENRRAPERGARFTLTLPNTAAPALVRTTSAATHAAAPAASPREADADRRRVLIVDDEAAIREALKRFFVRAGWEVSEAANGAAALAVIERGPKGAGDFSLIISDLRMPGISGIALHDWLASARPELVRRFVVSTGDVASPEAAAFVARVRCPVLEKPFDFGALDAIIREAAA